MKENDKITQLPKRTLSASNRLTPITNQANVAVRLGEAFGKEAHDRVWHCTDADWEDRAREYVDLVYGNHYGTRWLPNGIVVRADDTGSDADPRASEFRNVSRMVHPAYGNITHTYTPTSTTADRLDQISAEHPSPTPLAGLIRFVGGDGK